MTCTDCSIDLEVTVRQSNTAALASDFEVRHSLTFVDIVPKSVIPTPNKPQYIYSTDKSINIFLYTGCNRRNGPDSGRVFLMLNYTEKPQNTYIQS